MTYETVIKFSDCAWNSLYKHNATVLKISASAKKLIYKVYGCIFWVMMLNLICAK